MVLTLPSPKERVIQTASFANLSCFGIMCQLPRSKERGYLHQNSEALAEPKYALAKAMVILILLHALKGVAIEFIYCYSLTVDLRPSTVDICTTFSNYSLL